MAIARLLAAMLSIARGDLSFVAVADWGGDADDEPVTQSQQATAEGMMRQAKDIGAEFALMMGDNYYYHGIDCPAELTPRFAQTFEDVYPALLPDMTFYAVGGNHDYGEGQMSNISAQLAYDKMSPSWNFPSLWYSLDRKFLADGKERTLKLIFLDTVVLCGNGPKNERIIDQQLEFLGNKADPGAPGSLRRKIAENQWAWLEHELAKGSGVDYLWVTGHYPIWSVGNDGSQKCLIDRLLPLLQSYSAQYISGHDHNLEHFHHGGIDTFVVGAGKECCYDPKKMDSVPEGAMKFLVAGDRGKLSQPPMLAPVLGGFATVNFGAEFATVTLHKHTGEVIYVAPEIRRRVAALRIAAKVSKISASRAILCLLVLGVFLSVKVVARFLRHKKDACDRHYLLLVD